MSNADEVIVQGLGFILLILRAGFRGDDGWDAFVWARNALDEEYFEMLNAGGASSGYYAVSLATRAPMASR